MLCRTILRRASSRRSPGHRQEEGNWNPTRFPHCLTSQTRPHPSPNTHTPSSLWNLTQVKGLREYNLSKNVLYKSDLSKHLITTLKAGTTHYEQLKKNNSCCIQQRKIWRSGITVTLAGSPEPSSRKTSCRERRKIGRVLCVSTINPSWSSSSSTRPGCRERSARLPV